MMQNYTRTGTPNDFDRILGLRMGLTAMKLVLEDDFGKIVSLSDNKVRVIPLIEGAKKPNILEIKDLI